MHHGRRFGRTIQNNIIISYHCFIEIQNLTISQFMRPV